MYTNTPTIFKKGWWDVILGYQLHCCWVESLLAETVSDGWGIPMTSQSPIKPLRWTATPGISCVVSGMWNLTFGFTVFRTCALLVCNSGFKSGWAALAATCHPSAHLSYSLCIWWTSVCATRAKRAQRFLSVWVLIKAFNYRKENLYKTCPNFWWSTYLNSTPNSFLPGI